MFSSDPLSRLCSGPATVTCSFLLLIVSKTNAHPILLGILFIA